MQKYKNRSFEELLEIDEMRLDQEWKDHSDRFAYFGQKQAESRSEWEQAKAKLEVVKAELDLAIRKNPENYGLPKVTESVIASAIVTQPSYQETQQAVIEAKHAMDVYAVAVEAFEHRKKSLENLVSLHLSNYYAAPKAPAGKQEEVDEMRKKSIRRGKLKRRRDD